MIYFPVKFYHNTFIVIWIGSECQFWDYCGIFIKMCQCEETVYPMASNPGPGELQGMLVFFVSQLLIN